MRLFDVIVVSLLLLNPGQTSAAEPGGDIFSAIGANDMARLEEIVAQDPSALDRRSDTGLSPLMFAAYRERPEMVAVLHDKARHLDFHEACVSGDQQAVKRFLARGQDVERRSPDGFTPLGLSVFFRQPAVARLLIEAGADVNAKASNSLQVAPIHAAIARSDLQTLQLLLENGANPDLTQQRLMRPMHEAAAAGNLPAVAMLLIFGAEPDARNEEGKTPETAALKKAMDDVSYTITRVSPSNAPSAPKRRSTISA
jgi:uncharacterized protein